MRLPALNPFGAVGELPIPAGWVEIAAMRHTAINEAGTYFDLGLNVQQIRHEGSFERASGNYFVLSGNGQNLPIDTARGSYFYISLYPTFNINFDTAEAYRFNYEFSALTYDINSETGECKLNGQVFNAPPRGNGYAPGLIMFGMQTNVAHDFRVNNDQYITTNGARRKIKIIKNITTNEVSLFDTLTGKIATSQATWVEV